MGEGVQGVLVDLVDDGPLARLGRDGLGSKGSLSSMGRVQTREVWMDRSGVRRARGSPISSRKYTRVILKQRRTAGCDRATDETSDAGNWFLRR